jgi:hypothetical protein
MMFWDLNAEENKDKYIEDSTLREFFKILLMWTLGGQRMWYAFFIHDVPINPVFQSVECLLYTPNGALYFGLSDYERVRAKIDEFITRLVKDEL